MGVGVAAAAAAQPDHIAFVSSPEHATRVHTLAAAVAALRTLPASAASPPPPAAVSSAATPTATAPATARAAAEAAGKAQLATIAALLAVTGNLLKEPHNAVFRQLRTTNAKFQER